MFSFPSFKKIFAKFLNSWLKWSQYYIFALCCPLTTSLFWIQNLSFLISKNVKNVLRMLKKSDVDFYTRWERHMFWEEDKSFSFIFDLFLEFFRMSKCDFVCVCYDMFPKFNGCMSYIQNICCLVSIFAEQRHSMRYLS